MIPLFRQVPTRAVVEARQALRTHKAAPGPDRFTEVPMAAVEATGLRAARGPTAGQVKIDLALLAGAAWFYRVNVGRERTVYLETGDAVHLDGETIMLSMEAVARNLSARWGTGSGESGKAFYERVKDGFGRLERAGQIVHAGHPLGAARGRLGKLWTFTGTPTGDVVALLRETPRPTVLVTAPATRPAGPEAEAASFERDGMVNVVDLLAGLLAGERGLTGDHTRAQVAETLGSKRRRRVFSNWAPAKARRGDAVMGDHGTTGLFRSEDFGPDGRPKDGASAFVPYLVVEVDRGDASPVRKRHPNDPRPPVLRIDVDAVLESYAVAGRFVRAFEQLGVAPANLRACFSGRRGFHVYVPAGAFGAPVFSNADTAKGVLARFVASVLHEDVDEAVLSPRHLVRAVGARHEATGLYKVALPGDVFLRTDPYDFCGNSASFVPSTLPNPLSVPPAPDLVRLFVEALGTEPARAARPAGRPGLDRPDLWPAVFQRAMVGCAKGETWWPGKTGRDALVFELACFLLERADRDEATAVLEGVNAKCSPPLDPHVLEQKRDSAERTVARKA